MYEHEVENNLLVHPESKYSRREICTNYITNLLLNYFYLCLLHFKPLSEIVHIDENAEWRTVAAKCSVFTGCSSPFSSLRGLLSSI